jgi:hypothetical protein
MALLKYIYICITVVGCLQALQLSEYSLVHQKICRAAHPRTTRTMQDAATQMESDSVISIKKRGME